MSWALLRIVFSDIYIEKESRNAIKSFSGSGFDIKKPCIRSQLLSIANENCSGVSTPSTIIFRPSARPSETIELKMMRCFDEVCK